MEIKVIELEEVSSTNDFLKQYDADADIVVATTQFQTAGRGQMGNTWISDVGKNLLFSFLVTPPSLKANEGFVLSMAKALSLKESLEFWLSDVRIKWPNDIYCNNRKICGTLIENALSGKFVGRSVIGTGVNINQDFFPDGLAAPATSIRLMIGESVNTNDVLEKIIERFSYYYSMIQKREYEQIRTLYHNSLYLLGESHQFCDADGIFTATIHHVEPDGHIVMLDTEGHERRYAFKQVKLIRN